MATHIRLAIVLLLVMVTGPVSSARADDAVLRWIGHMVAALPPANPFVFSRAAAATQLAVFEAVNAITREYDPYLGTVAAPPDASPEAAAIAAAHKALLHFAPGAAAALDAARAQSLMDVPDGPAKDAGIAVGEAAAAAMIALRANDGAAPPPPPYVPVSPGSGEWALTGACAAGAAPHWGSVTTFGIKSGSQFRAKKPPTMTSDVYRRSYDEVRRMGGTDSVSRPGDRADVATLYNGLFPGPLWNRVALQLAQLDGGSMTAHARAFALLNMAMADGIITVWESKYRYGFWRPETAIRGGALDGNERTEPIEGFAPFITTPCHPSYPSGHAGVSNSARGVIESIWGDGGHSIVLDNPPLSPVVLHYDRISAIVVDIDDARIYGGIHFRFDQDAGTELGLEIARYILKRHLRPVR